MNSYNYINQVPGRKVQVQQQDCLYFSGTAYLGIPSHPEFLTILMQNLHQYGSNFGGSRKSNIRYRILEEAESFLAQLTGAEQALTTSSGTIAGQLLMRQFCSKDYRICYAPQVHPALILPNFSTTTKSYNNWTKEVITFSKTSKHPLLIVCNAIDPLYAQPIDFSWLTQLHHPHKHLLIVDDSHGLGITGINGGGFFSKNQVPLAMELIVVGSLAKAFGIPAGVILGSNKRLKEIWSSSMFSGASPAIPAYLATFITAQKLYQQQRLHLQTLIQDFQNLPITQQLFTSLPDYPIFHTNQTSLTSFLAKNQIIISAFPYPSPKDKLITRVILSAAHQKEDIHFLALILEQFFL